MCTQHTNTVSDVLERCSADHGLVIDYGHRYFGFDKESTLLGGRQACRIRRHPLSIRQPAKDLRS